MPLGFHHRKWERVAIAGSLVVIAGAFVYLVAGLMRTPSSDQAAPEPGQPMEDAPVRSVEARQSYSRPLTIYDLPVKPAATTMRNKDAAAYGVLIPEMDAAAAHPALPGNLSPMPAMPVAGGRARPSDEEREEDDLFGAKRESSGWGWLQDDINAGREKKEGGAPSWQQTRAEEGTMDDDQDQDRTSAAGRTTSGMFSDATLTADTRGRSPERTTGYSRDDAWRTYSGRTDVNDAYRDAHTSDELVDDSEDADGYRDNARAVNPVSAEAMMIARERESTSWLDRRPATAEEVFGFRTMRPPGLGFESGAAIDAASRAGLPDAGSMHDPNSSTWSPASFESTFSPAGSYPSTMAAGSQFETYSPTPASSAQGSSFSSSFSAEPSSLGRIATETEPSRISSGLTPERTMPGALPW